MGTHASARKNFNARTGAQHELVYSLASVAGCLLLSAGKHAGEADVDQLFQCAKRIGHDVESAMENRLPTTCEFDNLPTALGVDASIGMENAQHDSVGAMLQQKPSVALHDPEIRLGITETASARAHHYHHRNAHLRLRRDQRAQRRSEPARPDGRAQLYAIGAAALGCNAVVRRRGNDLQQDIRQLGFPLFASTISPGIRFVECGLAA